MASFNFLGLPTELRLKVYGHVFRNRVNRHPSLNILRTCRLICEEAQHILYTEHELFFVWHPVLPGLRPIPRCNVSWFRKSTLLIRIGDRGGALHMPPSWPPAAMCQDIFAQFSSINVRVIVRTPRPPRAVADIIFGSIQRHKAFRCLTHHFGTSPSPWVDQKLRFLGRFMLGRSVLERVMEKIISGPGSAWPKVHVQLTGLDPRWEPGFLLYWDERQKWYDLYIYPISRLNARWYSMSGRLSTELPKALKPSDWA